MQSEQELCYHKQSANNVLMQQTSDLRSDNELSRQIATNEASNWI